MSCGDITNPSGLIELRPVEFRRYIGEKLPDGRMNIWIKATAKLPDDPALHLCALAYASDFSLLDATMARYGRTVFESGVSAASLDHAMWFHRPFRADEWLLYSQDSPNARAGRGLARGLIFKRDGTLVASVAQEGSIREKAGLTNILRQTCQRACIGRTVYITKAARRAATRVTP